MTSFCLWERIGVIQIWEHFLHMYKKYVGLHVFLIFTHVINKHLYTPFFLSFFKLLLRYYFSPNMQLFYYWFWKIWAMLVKNKLISHSSIGLIYQLKNVFKSKCKKVFKNIAIIINKKVNHAWNFFIILKTSH